MVENMIYKEKNPKDTIKIIEEYMKKNFNVDLSYKKSNCEKLSPSYLLIDKKIGLIVNGKGVSDEYAKASACGELMERLYNRAFVRMLNRSHEMMEIKDKAFYYMSLKEAEHGLDNFLIKEGVYDGNIKNEMISYLRTYYCNNNLIEVPMINYKSDSKEVLIPKVISDYLFGTNGMAAGNSVNEAFVQAYSELMERKTVRDFNNGLIIPDLVGEDIEKDYILSKIVNNIKSREVECRIFSFERYMQYPVAFVLLVNKKLGLIKYKFGAHCNIKYAIERCFTELAQGCEWSDYNKWISIEKIKRTKNGENIKIFENGTGCISSLAYSNCIKSKKTYTSNWNVNTNEEAVQAIKKLQKEIYVKVYKRNPIAVVQLYVPGLNKLFEVESEMVSTDRKLLKKRILTYNIVNGSISEKELVCIKEAIEKENYEILFSKELLAFLCPIQKQYIKQISSKKMFTHLMEIEKECTQKKYTEIKENPLNYCRICKKNNTKECIMEERKRYCYILSEEYNEY